MSSLRSRLAAVETLDTLTVGQVAQIVQLHEQTIYRKVDRGEIPGVIRIGRTLRFARATIAIWAQARLDYHLANA